MCGECSLLSPPPPLWKTEFGTGSPKKSQPEPTGQGGFVLGYKSIHHFTVLFINYTKTYGINSVQKGNTKQI